MQNTPIEETPAEHFMGKRSARRFATHGISALSKLKRLVPSRFARRNEPLEPTAGCISANKFATIQPLRLSAEIIFLNIGVYHA